VAEKKILGRFRVVFNIPYPPLGNTGAAGDRMRDLPPKIKLKIGKRNGNGIGVKNENDEAMIS